MAVQKNINFNEDFKFYDNFEDENENQISGDAIKENSISTILTPQDQIDQDFPDIARLNIVQVSGDDRTGKIVIIIYACRIPPVNEINLYHLWEYIVQTMKRFVLNDYSLLYFHHGLTNRKNPGVRFLLRVYRQIDRDYKKNLKYLFIVHPSNMLKVIITALLPFLSQKVKNKIIKLERLKHLDDYFYLDQISIPDVVKEHDLKMNGFISIMGRWKEARDFTLFYSNETDKSFTKAQFGVTLQQVKEVYPDHSLPPVMEQCIAYIRKECLDYEGIFRRSSSKILLDDVQRKFNRDECVDLQKYQNPHLTACLLKTFLRSLKEPLMTFALYDEIMKIHNMTNDEVVLHITTIITKSLPHLNYHVLKYLIDFLQEVASHSDKNMMTTHNLANVFAPNLCWSKGGSSFTAIHVIIKFTFLLIENADIIFVKQYL